MNKKEIIITLFFTTCILFVSALTVFGSNDTNLTNNNVISEETNQDRSLTSALLCIDGFKGFPCV